MFGMVDRKLGPAGYLEEWKKQGCAKFCHLGSRILAFVSNSNQHEIERSIYARSVPLETCCSFMTDFQNKVQWYCCMCVWMWRRLHNSILRWPRDTKLNNTLTLIDRHVIRIFVKSSIPQNRPRAIWQVKNNSLLRSPFNSIIHHSWQPCSPSILQFTYGGAVPIHI